MNLHTNLDLTAVLGILAVTATFSRNLSGLWAGFGELFWKFQQLQLLFSDFIQFLG